MASSTHGSGSSPSSTQAVDRAVRLLMAVAFEPKLASVRELAEHCGMNRSTAHRLLGALERHGLVEKNPLTNAYHVGYAALAIAHAADPDDALLHRARPEMERLRDVTDDTVTLTVVNGLQLFVASAVYPEHMVRPVTVTGRLLPLHATSMGKAFLACLSDEELGVVLAETLPAFTAATLSVAELREEITGIRELGYASSAGEFEEGLNGVASVIRDRGRRVVAGITVVGPNYRVSADRFDEIGPLVAGAAERIGNLL